MTPNTISLLTLFTYGSASVLQILKIFRKLAFSRLLFISLVLLATTLHGYLLYLWIDTPKGQNLSLSHLFSLTCWLCSLATLAISLKSAYQNLILFILPISIVSILIALGFPGSDFFQTRDNISTLIHILISILAFSALGIATLQVALWCLQNHILKNKSFQPFVQILPPLQTIENQLFQILMLGFILLSASLLSIFLLSDENLISNHPEKVVFSSLAWILFADLLYQRYHTGLRGLKAMRRTLLGLGFFMTAYLAHKMIFSAPYN